MSERTTLALSVILFLVAAKAHGRELRLEREAAGVRQVIFGGHNPPFVEELWRGERRRFWVTTPLVAAGLGALLLARGAPGGRVALAALGWAPSLAFAALGALSIERAGGLARGHLAGSAGWWTLAAAAAAAVARSAQARG